MLDAVKKIGARDVRMDTVSVYLRHVSKSLYQAGFEEESDMQNYF